MGALVMRASIFFGEEWRREGVEERRSEGVKEWRSVGGKQFVNNQEFRHPIKWVSILKN